MPPKKGEAPKQPPLIGRFGTSLKIGIVGLPNVGYVHVISNVDICKARLSCVRANEPMVDSSFRVSYTAVDTLLTLLSTAGSPPFSMC